MKMRDRVIERVWNKLGDNSGYAPVEIIDLLMLIVVATTLGFSFLERILPVINTGYSNIENGVRVLKGGGII